MKNEDEFEFDSPLKAFSKNEIRKDMNFGSMFELQNKRKASISPESKDLSRKEKKAAKKEQRSKAKNEMRAKMQLDISPQKE